MLRDKLRFRGRRTQVLPPSDDKRGDGDARQKFREVGSFENRAGALENILRIRKVEDQVAISLNQLGLLAKSRFGKEEWERRVGNRGSLARVKTLPKVATFARANPADQVAPMLQLARGPRKNQDACRRCVTRASRRWNGQPKPAPSDRDGSVIHRNPRPSPPGSKEHELHSVHVREHRGGRYESCFRALG